VPFRTFSASAPTIEHVEEPGRGTARDAGLRRISRLTGWTAAGAVIAVGGLAGVAANAHPGRASHAPRAAVPATDTTPGQPPGAPAQDSQSQPDLQAPAQAPSPAPSDAPPAAVSGGS